MIQGIGQLADFVFAMNVERLRQVAVGHALGESDALHDRLCDSSRDEPGHGYYGQAGDYRGKRQNHESAPRLRLAVGFGVGQHLIDFVFGKT